MKNYQKAEMIAKNLPTGSYAAGCPEHTAYAGHCYKDGNITDCRTCEISA